MPLGLSPIASANILDFEVWNVGYKEMVIQF